MYDPQVHQRLEEEEGQPTSLLLNEGIDRRLVPRRTPAGRHFFFAAPAAGLPAAALPVAAAPSAPSSFAFFFFFMTIL